MSSLPISYVGNDTTERFRNVVSLATTSGQALLQSPQQVAVAVVMGLLVAYVYSQVLTHFGGPRAPIVGIRSKLEPRVVSGAYFFRNAASVLNEGYNKFTKKPWKFVRADTDMLVLPPQYVDELRSLPHSIASPTVAHAFNLSSHVTNMDIILKNNLHFRTLQERLTPNLAKLTRPMQDELAFGIRRELPECPDEWVSIQPYHTILRLVARISARIFLGLPLCRDERWLEISTEFTENVFVSLVILRLFPTWMHRVVGWCLPSTYICCGYIRQAKRLLAPEFTKRLAEKDDDGQPSLLNWMSELASGAERSPTDLAHLEVVMSLASIHTSQMNAVHIMYDLASLPASFTEELREEIRGVIATDGPWSRWDKTSFSKLPKLDSLMRESQRLNPPTLLSYHRVMTSDFVLKDGTLLPRGAHISMPVNAIQNGVTPDADEFDPLRYYRLRQQPGEHHRHQFASTEPTILNFGHGKYACPGRFFASLEIKIILTRLIMDYDWKLPEGTTRPPNLVAHEFIFPNQKGTLLMKSRMEVTTGPMGSTNGSP